MARIRILLVEDEAAHRELLQLLLADTGLELEVECRRGLPEALDPGGASPKHFDLILSDLQLDLHGPADVLGALRSAAPQVPLVALSAREDPEIRQMVAEAGAHSLVAKMDLSAPGLRASIEDALAGGAQGSSSR